MRPSVAIQKFANALWRAQGEFLNQGATLATFGFRVCLLDLKFALRSTRTPANFKTSTLGGDLLRLVSLRREANKRAPRADLTLGRRGVV